MHSPIRVPVTTPGSIADAPPLPPSPRILLAGGAGLIIVLVLLLTIVMTFMNGGDDDGGNDSIVTAPTEVPTAMPTVMPTPSCQSVSNWIDQLTYLMDKGLWKEASDTAQVALAAPNPCPDGPDALQELAITAGLEALFDEPFDPRDLASQEAQVDRFYRLREQAARYRVELPSDLTLARRARVGGQFLLAKTAFEEALEAGALQPEDRENLRAYVSTLHDLGRWWLTSPNKELHDQGGQLLADCMALDVEYRLGSGACYGALQELVSPDPADWLEPSHQPLLGSNMPSEGSR